jgi:small subunit ribosomal protein S8
MNDPIGDLLSRLKNALGARLEHLDVPHSRLKEGVAALLVSEGYLAKFDVLKKMEKKYLRLTPKYRASKKPVITGLRRVSTPGRRAYASVAQLPRVQAGFGTAIISTSRGLMTDSQARAQNLGGEVLCWVW